MLPTVSAGELFSNRRYATYDANIIDIEDQKAYAQSNFDKAANGVLKGLNLVATTVAGTGAMLGGAVKSIFSGRLADIWDNELSRDLDEWNNKVDNEFLPNYYTNAEKNTEWYSTTNWFKTNFLFDKLIKNAGFAVGAMVTGNMANAGLLKLGSAVGKAAMAGATATEASQAFKLFTPLLRNTARAFSTGKNIEVANILEGGLSDIADVTAKASKIAELSKLSNSFAKFGDVGRRSLVAGFSSAGEASFEAIQTGNEFKKSLIEEYKATHNGEEPTGRDLESINSRTDSVGATSFFGNMALLSITEYVQLPKLLGSNYSASKQAANSLMGRTDDVLLKEGKYVAKEATTKFGKLYDRVTGVSRYVFDPKEAAQEGLQYALQVGTQNYFKKAGESNDANAWVDGVLYGLVGRDASGKGVGTFVSKEGMESIALGGLTGGLMQIKGNIQESRALKTNTQNFINELDPAPTFKEAFKERLAGANRGVVLQQQQQAAVIQGDKLEAKDLDADMMHNYIAPRIKYGRFDMVMDDIADLKREGSTEQGLAALKQQGFANINDTIQSYQQRLSNFETVAKNTQEIYKATDLRFSGEVLRDDNGEAILTPDGKQQKKYSPQVIDKMVYAASKVADYDLRIPQVAAAAISKGIDIQSIVDDELSNDSSVALASQLNELDKNGDPISTPNTKQSVKDVVEMSLRRRKFLNEYKDMVNNPNAYDETGERKGTNKQGKKFRTTPSSEPEKGGPNYAVQSRLPFKGDKRTYDDLVNQYGQGTQSKYEVLKKILESPYATTMEKELAAQFMKFTDRNAKIILGDRTLPNPGVSTTTLTSPTDAISRINFEYNADDYEGTTIPVEYVILHEIGHDLTVYALSDKSNSFYDELLPLFNFVQEHFKKDENKYSKNGLIRNGEFYAFKNIKEFATEALSNRDFQRYLDSIPYKNTQRSTWDTFVDNLKTFFRRLFGIEDDTALDEVVGIVTNNIDKVYKSQAQQNKKLTEEEELRKKEIDKLKKNKEEITKQQGEIVNNSGTVGTNNPNKDSVAPEGKIPPASILFISGTSESEAEGYYIDENGEPLDPKQAAINLRNQREFLNNVGGMANRKNMRAILVTPALAKAYGLEGLVELSYNKPLSEIPDVESVDKGFIAQVFVEQVGDRLFFVDKEGNQIGEVGVQVENLSDVVFQTMRTTELNYKSGAPRHRKDQKAEAEAYAAAWKIQRAKIFSIDPNESPTPFAFQVSRGIAKMGDVDNHISGVLIDEKTEAQTLATDQTLIQIPTAGVVAHHTGQINVPNGRPMLVHNDNVEFLNNRKFTKKQAEGIYEVIKQIATEINEQSNAGKRIIINKKLSRFLQNVLYWRLGKTEAESNQINISEDGSSISLSGNTYSIPEIAERKDDIIETLEKTFHNVNNDPLTPENFSKPFTEYYMKDGVLVSNDWTNYQTYLLSSKYPNGSSRSVEDTPLSTKITKPTDAVPTTHEQKYSTLVGLELPVGVIAKPVPPAAPPVAPPTQSKRKYDYDGETDNIFTTPFGDVIFTVKEGEDPKFDQEDKTFKTTRDKIIKKLNDVRIKKGEAPLSEEELIPQANSIIITYVKKELETDVVVAPAPPVVVVPPVAPIVPPAPLTEIEKLEKERDDKLFELITGTETTEEFDNNPAVIKIRAEYQAKIDALKGTTSAPISTNAKADSLKRGDIIKFQLDEYQVERVTENSIDVRNLKTGDSEVISKEDYNAELAALEGGQVSTPKEPGSFNPNNIGKRDDVGFRKVGKDRTDRMTEADLKAFKEWHAKYVPFIPFEVLENMINLHNGEKAWGVFENGVAKFVKGGLRGTEYHEVGEAIWNGMLTKEERAALIAEFRNKTGQFTDRETGKKYNHDDPTVSDDMVKERILDDFADFRVGKLPVRTLGEKITNFFRRILDFIKSFVAKPSLKEELFKAIESGKFKDRQLSTESKSIPPQYRGAGHLTEEETNAYVKDMMAIASNIIFGSGKMGTIDKTALYNLRNLTSDDIFSMIDEFYTKQGVRQELGDIAWKDLVIKTKQELKTLLKVDFNEEDLVNINEGETNKNDYTREPFSTDWKKNAPMGIKFASATLLDRVPTNQEDSNSFNLPKPKINKKYQTFSLLPYTRAFVTMLDAFKNTTSIGKLIGKVVKLGNEDANYVSMFQRLGGNMENKTINFKDFKFEDWRFFIEFMQTYTKQKPNAVIQYISQGQVYSGSALVTGIVNKTVNSWVSNLKGLSKEEDSVIKWDSVDKSYSVTDLSGIPSGTPEEKEKFLAKLGIIFPLEAWAKLKDPQKIEFTLAVANIKEYLQKAKEIKSIQKNTLDVGGHYDTLATLLVNVTHPNQESTRINIDGKQSNSFTDNNVPSVFENEFNEAKTLDELLAIRPELKDLYSRGALLLKKGGQFFDKDGKRTKLELKVGYIEGTKDKDKNKGTSSTALTEGDRYTQEINQNLTGQYYIMIPADGSTEWMMNMGNHVAFEDIEQGKDGWKKINEIFRGYLTDDVALALDADNRMQVENVGGLRKIADIESKLETLKAVTNKSDAQKEEVKKLNAQLEYLKKKPYELRFFKDILSEKTLTKINQMIEENATQQDIESFIDDNIEDVNASIKEYIDGTVAKTKDFLLQNNQVKFVTRDAATGIDYYRYDMLNGKFAINEKLNKSKLTIDDLTNIITFANANYIINNIEFHKIIFGDPYQFAIKEDGTLDATKRFKSFFSPRRTTIDSPELNTFINEDLNNAGDIQLLPGEPGYHQAKAWMDTVTVSDVNIVGSVTNMKNVPEDVKKAFAKTNEGDAASIMMDGTYREMKIKNGQWNIKGVEEAWHQWQMAYTRQNLPGFKYSEDVRGKALEKHDIALLKTKQPDHKIEIVKPIVSGVTNGVNRINLVLDKFSQMPLYYSMVQGTNLEKLYLKMMAEKKGYIIMISGRKVGAEALHDLYTKNGQFNDAAFNNNIEIPWKAYGIQVETAYEGSGMQTRGSQVTKISTLDLYENGEPIGATPQRKEEIAKEVARNRDILNRLHKNGYERFLKRLGIEDLGGSYKINDKTRLAKTLQDEMFRRELSDNVKDSIQLDENKEFIIPFEASPAYLQIKSILYSFIDKEITSPKMNGGAYVQAPVTLWENEKAGRKIAIKTADGYKQITRQEFDALSAEEQKKVVLTDDTLKFYEDEDGKRYCEVMLPHWFKSKLGKHANKSDEELIKFLNTTAEGKELLSGIGFRIPTQSLSSVEAFKVKAFLPKYMGKTVIVPSEITTKSGSDFDIDKLNMYLKSVYIDKNGEIRIIKLKGTEEATKDFYAKVFDEKLELQKINKAELFDAATIMVEGLDDPKNLGDRYADAIDILFAEANTLEEKRDVLDDIMKRLEKLGDKDAQALLKEKFVEDSYRRALENEYYDSLEKLVTMPENFQRLISPVSDDGLKDLSNVLDELRGYDESKIKNRLLDRNYMTSLRHAFVTAKKWVGIAAVNITGHSLTQKFKAYIDPARFNNVSKEDRDILRYNGGEMLLDHNTIEDNGKSYISLSGRLDTDGKFISDGLSGYATSFVDVAKDPYILKIIKNNLAVGTFMFLRRTGVPSRQLVMFMNQPIINEYLTMLDNKGVKTLFDTRQISAIKNKFPSRVAETASTLGFNKGELEANIKNYYATKDLGDAKNREQVAIFNEFLKYSKMAEYSFNFGQASNYDTTKFQSGDSLQLKQWRTEAAQKKNIISSVGNLLQNNFIGVQAEYLDMSMDALGEALVLETPQFTDVTNEVLKSFEQDRFLTKDKFDRIANKIKAAFLDYIIQKRSDIATNLQEQLVDDRKSVAQMLLKAKQEFPGVQILEDLEVDSSGRIGGAQTIKLKVNDKIAYNENMYAGMMRELRDDPRTNALYKGIVRLAIIQGTYQSPISIKNIIPVEDYSAHITPILAGLTVDDEIRAFATSNEFQRNEWQDNDVVPVIEPTFEAEEQDSYAIINDLPRTFQGRTKKLGKFNDQEILVPGFFPVVKELGANLKKQRDLLFISAKYQGKVANYDVIKVPRTVPINKKDVTEGRIDVATGKEITARDYAKMAEKGDLSLRNYYGYQKVKYADGSPVIARYDKDGNPTYVYKFINLHGDGQYATEYYGDGRPSIFNNGSEKNIKNIEGTLVSNEIPDQAIIDFYGGETVTQDLADPIIATIEKESEKVEDIGRQAEIEPGYGLTAANFESPEGLDEALAKQAEIENKISKLEERIENGVAGPNDYKDLENYKKQLTAQPTQPVSEKAEEGLKLPEYTVDKTLKNTDGSIRYASTDGGKIIINPVSDANKFFDYFEGKEGGPTSAQKAQVLSELAKQGYTIDVIKSMLNTNKLINTFLILHEQSHIDNNDKDVYWLNSKDLLTPDKIAIEVRATVDALEKLGGKPSAPQTFDPNNEDLDGADEPNPCGII
jgi:hypothetical protein